MNQGADHQGPEPGFKGWLLVLLVFQFLILAYYCLRFAQETRTYIAGIPSAGLEPFSILYLGLLLMSAPFLALVAYTIFVMSQRRDAFYRWFRMEMRYYIVLPMAQMFWLLVAPWPGHVGFPVPLLMPIAVNLAVGLGWLNYLDRSARVRATFTK